MTRFNLRLLLRLFAWEPAAAAAAGRLRAVTRARRRRHPWPPTAPGCRELYLPHIKRPARLPCALLHPRSLYVYVYIRGWAHMHPCHTRFTLPSNTAIHGKQTELLIASHRYSLSHVDVAVRWLRAALAGSLPAGTPPSALTRGSSFASANLTDLVLAMLICLLTPSSSMVGSWASNWLGGASAMRTTTSGSVGTLCAAASYAEDPRPVIKPGKGSRPFRAASVHALLPHGCSHDISVKGH